MKKQKYIYSKDLENYFLTDPNSNKPLSSSDHKSDSSNETGSKKKMVFESKSTFMGSGIIGQFNQIRMALGLADSKKRTKAMALVGGFAALLAFVVYAAPGPDKRSKNDPASVIAVRSDSPASESDVNHYLAEKQKSAEPKQEMKSPEEPEEAVVSSPAPSVPAAKPKSPSIELPQPETMIVYKYKQPAGPNPVNNSAPSSIFHTGKLLTNIEVSTLGGTLAVGELMDGRIVYGNAEMAPELDRIYINFTEEQLPDGVHRRGVRYALVDLNKTQGLPASCSDLNNSNILQKGLAVGTNALSAAAGARNRDAYSAQDAARERVAAELDDQAKYSARSGRIRSCVVQAGSQFYAVQTAMGQ